MSMTIGLFGGTFDPVHLGHRYLLDEVMKAVRFDRVYIIPAKIPPHKAASGMTSEQDRFEMCRLAFSDLDSVFVSDFEMKNEGKSYSYNTVKHFKELHPEDKLYFIMGSDQLLSFDSWYRPDDILEMTGIIAVSRDDDISNSELEAKASSLSKGKDSIIIVGTKPFELSSTQIRNAVGSGEDVSGFLAPKVYEYIKSKGLYRQEADSGMCKKDKNYYKDYIKEHLSKKRAQHSINVADAAVRLAKLYGADEDKAFIAGMLHDVCKELPPDEQLKLVMRSELDVSEVEKTAPPLFHAVAGSVFIQDEFGIKDTDIIRAVRYHTVGCGNMDKLSQIIYLADLISDDRDYKDVKKMRRYAEQGLGKAMLEALKFSITDSVGKGNTIPVCTLECYNDLVKASKKKEE